MSKEVNVTSLECYQKKLEAFTVTVKKQFTNPKELIKAVREYQHYMVEVDLTNTAANKEGKVGIPDSAFGTFLAMEPYLEYVKEKIGYEVSEDGKKEEAALSAGKLNADESELFKEVQLLLWNRIAGHVIARYRWEFAYVGNGNRDYVYDALHTSMYVAFVLKMLLRYKPSSYDGSNLVTPKNYFMKYIYADVAEEYRKELNE